MGRTLKNISSLPGPKIWPVLGSIEYLRNGLKNIHLTFASEERKYGAMFKSSIFGYSFVHVSNPSIAEEICRAEPKWPLFDLDMIFKELYVEAARLGYPAFLGKRYVLSNRHCEPGSFVGVHQTWPKQKIDILTQQVPPTLGTRAKKIIKRKNKKGQKIDVLLSFDQSLLLIRLSSA